MPWKGSALLDGKTKLPKNRDENAMSGEIPATYVPGRNSVFLSMAMSCAETEGAEAIFIGANVMDYSGYPDCRPEYLNAVAAAMWGGTKAGVEGKKIEIKAPLIKLSKKEIVLLGQKLGVPFEKTWSCYAGEDAPCGTCDSCILRAKGFREAGIPDPLIP
jgi:7-cyano-7-deazaguanine synthase